MKKGLSLLALLGAFVIKADAQTIKGKITDDEGQPLSEVTVSLKNTLTAVLTNHQGEYHLGLKAPGTYTVQFQHVGFQPVERELTLSADTMVELSAQLQKAISSLKAVTVTASRKAEIVDRTPAAVQVIGTKDIQTQLQISPNISNVLAQAAPAIAFGTNTTSNTGQTLRGRTPLVLVDGIPQTTPLRAGARELRAIDPAVLERVEVVKGATAIYGNGADGGVINYITKKAATAKPFNAYTYLANTGMPVHGSHTLGYRATQQFNGTLNRFDYIVSGTYEKTGVSKDAKGVALSPTYGLGESNIYDAFAKLGYNITPKHRVEAMYNFFGSAQHSGYVQKTGKYGLTPTIGEKGERRGEQEGTRYNHNAYFKYTGRDLFLNTSVEANAYAQSFYTVYGFEPTFFENGGQSTIKSDKIGARLNLNTPYRIAPWWNGDLVYGIDAMHDVTAQVLTDGRLWTPEMKMTNSAPYLQANATLFNDFIFKAGYRYDDVHLDVPGFTQLKVLQNGQYKGGNTYKGDSVAFDASTYNVGLRYARFELFKPFVSYTQGFSIIDIGRYVRGPAQTTINDDIRPVRVNNLEMGASSSHRYFDLSASYFISKNKEGASLKAENGIYVQQKAPEKTWGYELQADVRPIDKLSFGGAYVWVEGKADKDSNNKFDDAKDIYLSGTKISAPKATAYVRYAPIKAVSLYAQWLHFGDRKRFAPKADGTYNLGEGPVESEGIVNLSSSWQINKTFQLSLGVENLLNKDYFAPIAQWQAQDGDYIKANGIRYQLGVGIKW